MTIEIASVIVNWNKKEEVLNLIESLLNIEKPKFDIFAIDNSSTDNSVDAIKKKYPFIHLIVNDHNLMSAYADDYGQEHWIAKCLDDYADPEDAVILLSCSGKSKNVINASTIAKEKGLPIVSFTGFKPENILRTSGDLNFWVDSQNYNITEATHTILIFCVGDMLANETEYLASK